MTQPSSLLFVGPKRRYHAAHSGYEALVPSLGPNARSLRLSDRVDRAAGAVTSLVPADRRRRWLAPWAGERWYGRRRVLEELATAPTLLWARNTIVHHLYAEESLRLSGWIPRLRGSRLVGTFHMPASRFAKSFPRPSWLRRLDALIVVSRAQIPVLEPWALPGRVFFVPLGVDADFFTPAPEPPPEFRCLFVGYFLRDFDTLEAVVDRLAPHGVPFDLVLTPGKARRFRDRPGVTVWSSVDDDTLRERYRQAGVLVLPLLDNTSNNAIVEAMACGLPVIANDVGGVRDYCGPQHSLVLPDRDPDAFTDAVLRLRDDSARHREMRVQARKRAVRDFDWRVVAGAVRDVYRHALAR